MGHELLRIGVRTPASVANIGVGFDCLAFAIDLWNEYVLYVDTLESPPGLRQFTFEPFTGRYARVQPQRLASESGNAFVRAFQDVRRDLAELAGGDVPSSRCLVEQVVAIPPWRGLGSSSSAAVAGTLAAFAYFDHFAEVDSRDVVRHMRKNIHDQHHFDEVVASLALATDDCPDNLCASLSGGLTYSFTKEGDPHEIPSKQLYFFRDELTDPDLRCVVLIPTKEMRTDVARAKLKPDGYRLDEDVVYHLSRSTCVPAVFATRRYELLKDVTLDRLHTDVRAATMFRDDRGRIPLRRIFSQAEKAGAYCGFLAGAGSSLAALTSQRASRAVSDAMRGVFEKTALEGWDVDDVRSFPLTNSRASITTDIVDAATLDNAWAASLDASRPKVWIGRRSEPKYSAFWCYNRDEPSATTLAEWIEGHGIRTWRDKMHLRKGRWKREIHDAIRASRTWVICIGANGIAEGPDRFQKEEIEACLSEGAKRGVSPIPVLLPGAMDFKELPFGLGDFQGIDMRDGISPEGVRRLVDAINLDHEVRAPKLGPYERP